MEFIAKRVIFQEIKLEDADLVHQLHSHPKVSEFSTLGIPQTMSETLKRVHSFLLSQNQEPRKFYDWKIVERKTKTFMGMAGISLSLNKFRLGEIYYELLPDFWGKGYATEVARKLIYVGFEEFHLHKVEAGVDTENVKSIRILEKLGMTREGRRRKILPIRGEWRDNYHYAIVEDDPRNQHAKSEE